jgi:hypothetical protein
MNIFETLHNTQLKSKRMAEQAELTNNTGSQERRGHKSSKKTS